MPDRVAKTLVGTVWVCGAALALAGVGRAQATASQVLICYPNAPGTSDEARPVMTRFGQYLGSKGAPCDPVYFNEVRPAVSFIEDAHPRFAILSLALYLKWRDTYHLVPVSLSERRGATRERFHLLVAKDSPLQGLDDLGARGADRPIYVWSSHLDDLRFARNVVFQGKLALDVDAGPVRIVSTNQPLRALRRIKSGEAFEGKTVDAVLVDDTTWAGLQRLKTFEGVLRVAYTSPDLPTPPVLAFPGTDPAEVGRLRAALEGMRDDPEGQQLLKTLQVTGFGGPEPEALDAAAKVYARELDR